MKERVRDRRADSESEIVEADMLAFSENHSLAANRTDQS
jgi:hypothetical protein